MIQRLHTCTSNLSQHDPLSAPAYVARFTERLLGGLNSRSRPTTAHASPAMAPADLMAGFDAVADWSLDLVCPASLLGSAIMTGNRMSFSARATRCRGLRPSTGTIGKNG